MRGRFGVHRLGLTLLAMLLLATTGCASQISSWIVQTRNHQGDLALDHQNSADASIAYQIVGDGPVDIVLLPGAPSHVDVRWEHPASAVFFERLATFSRLILFDRRGLGASDRLPPDTTGEGVCRPNGAARSTCAPTTSHHVHRPEPRRSFAA